MMDKPTRNLYKLDILIAIIVAILLFVWSILSGDFIILLSMLLFAPIVFYFFGICFILLLLFAKPDGWPMSRIKEGFLFLNKSLIYGYLIIALIGISGFIINHILVTFFHTSQNQKSISDLANTLEKLLEFFTEFSP